MADSSENQGSVFDLDRIRELIELMKEHELSEVDLKQDEQQIRLSRGAQGGLVSVPAAVPAAAPAPQQAAPAPAAAAEASEENIAYITSPIVGTFYTKPNPNAESFVKVGDSVEPDTTVCIVEAMKVFNEIPAEIRGKIVAVLVDEEEAVDVGKRLYKVDTSG